ARATARHLTVVNRPFPAHETPAYRYIGTPEEHFVPVAPAGDSAANPQLTVVSTDGWDPTLSGDSVVRGRRLLVRAIYRKVALAAVHVLAVLPSLFWVAGVLDRHPRGMFAVHHDLHLSAKVDVPEHAFAGRAFLFRVPAGANDGY